MKAKIYKLKQNEFGEGCADCGEGNRYAPVPNGYTLLIVIACVIAMGFLYFTVKKLLATQGGL